MEDRLVLRISTEFELSVSRGAGVPGQVRGFLSRLDADMGAGIELAGRRIEAPNTRQRCEYVIGELLGAVAAERLDLARTLLLYLRLHWPELRCIRVSESAGSWSVELDSDD